MLINSRFSCAFCGEPNDATVDPSAGVRQSYTEDCQVCCRPNVLFISLRRTRLGWRAAIDADPESDME